MLGGSLVRGVLGIEFNPGTMCEGHVWFEYWVTLQMHSPTAHLSGPRVIVRDTSDRRRLLAMPSATGGYSCSLGVRIYFLPPISFKKITKAYKLDNLCVAALEVLEQSLFPLVSHYNHLQDLITKIITILITIILIGSRV